MLEIMYRTMQADPDAIWVNVLGKQTGFTPESREVVSGFDVKWKFHTVAYVGGTLPMRAVVSLIMRALVVLGRYQGGIKVFATEDELRQWLTPLQESRKS